MEVETDYNQNRYYDDAYFQEISFLKHYAYTEEENMIDENKQIENSVVSNIQDLKIKEDNVCKEILTLQNRIKTLEIERSDINKLITQQKIDCQAAYASKIRQRKICNHTTLTHQSFQRKNRF
ncbi:hypothetical protein ABPG72_018587 [Tetrahymena utriculariae]